MYDPVDGGPTLVAERADTATGRARRRGRLRSTEGTLTDSRSAFVAVTAVEDFRVIRASVDLSHPDTFGLGPADADALGVEAGALLAVAEVTDTTDKERTTA
jgi:arginine/ornithine N-succinyltransferase beta subunit